ncbi:lactadherin-like [Asterias amurensis]|uniref:lactadherin-like n=1 Tax=Asterias amurensis TaxID=7602 RepID=UPI003AB3D5AD
MMVLHHFVCGVSLRILPLFMFLVSIDVVDSKMASYYGPIPEPESISSGRYHWVKSAMEKLRSGCQSMEVCSIDMEQRLGMANGDIPDDRITASSYASNLLNGNSYPPERARLDITDFPPGWCAKVLSPNPWIQVDLQDRVFITALITQGYDGDYYVTKYEVSYSDDGQQWDYVNSADGTRTEFTGNNDGESHVTARFEDGFMARFVRISPLLWNLGTRTDYCCMRFEVLGCKK